MAHRVNSKSTKPEYIEFQTAKLPSRGRHKHREIFTEGNEVNEGEIPKDKVQKQKI
jgi:hypothetical protein